MSEAKNKLNIGIIVDTNKLSAKLKAIAKHTQALAEELEQIDRDVCPNCNVALEVTTYYAGGHEYAKHYVCPKCGYTPSDRDG